MSAGSPGARGDAFSIRNMPEFAYNPTHWLVVLAIVTAGLLVYGFRDVLRFSLKRVWAISRICYMESVRRRVLLIMPLAMLGVIVVSQLQQPTDEQDAIRQTIKFTLFAAGLVVTTTSLILACTNLPREIESRVIYTIVTKPTTRLEIVLGKVLGFAKVSAVNLLVMGAFAFVYLGIQNYLLVRDIRGRLVEGSIDPLSRATYEYWSHEGLLTAKTFAQATDLQVYAHEPAAGDPRRWFYGSGDGDMIVPFNVSPEELLPRGGAMPAENGVEFILRVGFAPSLHGRAATARRGALPVAIANPDAVPTTQQATEVDSAQVRLEILDHNRDTVISSSQINAGQSITLTDPTGNTPAVVKLSRELAQNLLSLPFFFVSVAGASPGVEYFGVISQDPNPLNNSVCLTVPAIAPNSTNVFGPANIGDGARYVPAAPIFRGRGGVSEQQLRGASAEQAPVAVYRFRDVPPQRDGSMVGLEFRCGIERSDDDSDGSTPTRVDIVIRNGLSTTGGTSLVIYPENNRTAYFNVPAEALAGGNFDLLLRNASTGHRLALNTPTIKLVAAEQPFFWNLFKSLSILWMLSILVVILSIFCSTFLSWPIAVVLTMMLLTGHWVVSQLGSALAPGIGTSVATDLGFRDPSQAKVVSKTVEAMSQLATQLSRVLPDISQFAAVDEIERGIAISPPSLLSPIFVLLGFGVPFLVGAYVMLCNKEVAP
jgi:ABC-type transport system involved in multi-copper enzyme maturation permease subunit